MFRRILVALKHRRHPGGNTSSIWFQTDPRRIEAGEGGFHKEFEETLERTVEHPELNRKVSYQYLLRIEAYKLKKHLLAGEPYDAFRRWW